MFEHIPPPLTYIGRVKGILNHVLGYNLFPKFFFGNIEEIARPVLGQDFDVMVCTKKFLIQILTLSNFNPIVSITRFS